MDKIPKKRKNEGKSDIDGSNPPFLKYEFRED